MTEELYTINRDLDLKKEMESTLATPVMKANFILKGMFITVDILYGRKRTLPKFKIIEMLARYPYWAWENSAYYRISKICCCTRPAPREKIEQYLYWIDLGRESQDNEQWHLLLLDDIIQQKGVKLGWFRYHFLPRVMAGTYYHLTRIMMRMKPSWSFAMNAAFESHAEHQYMLMAQENPGWDDEKVDSVYFKHYPKQKTLGDLIRRIGLDERDHMNRSIAELAKLRS